MSQVLVLELEGGRGRRSLARGRLTIGRGPGNDWVIEDSAPTPTISRSHCVIEGDGTSFSLTDLGSTNGTFVNDRQVPAHSSVRISAGDRVRMGSQGLLLSWQQAAQAIAADARAQPVRKERAEPVRAPAPSLDDVLGGFGLAEEQPAAAPAHDLRAFGPDDDPLGGQFNHAPARPAPQAPPRDLGNTAGDHTQPQLESFRYQSPAPQPVDPLFEIAPPSPPAAPAEHASDKLEGERLVAAFLAGAGVAASDLDGEADERFFRELGAAFAAMADGFRVLLAARALVKDHAGVERTMIRATDNNPLKYSVNTREAVMALIAPRGAGYLSPLAAVEAALRDLKAHEIAVLDGMRAALQGLLDRFDPAELERRLADDSSLSVLLQGGKRAKLWELYTERYAEIAEAARRRYLGDFDRAFKEAYERKIRDVRSEGGGNLR